MDLSSIIPAAWADRAAKFDAADEEAYYASHAVTPWPVEVLGRSWAWLRDLRPVLPERREVARTR